MAAMLTALRVVAACAGPPAMENPLAKAAPKSPTWLKAIHNSAAGEVLRAFSKLLIVAGVLFAVGLVTFSFKLLFINYLKFGPPAIFLATICSVVVLALVMSVLACAYAPRDD